MTALEIALGFNEESKRAWLEINSRYDADPLAAWDRKIQMHANPPKSASVYVMQSYQSPITNQWIDTPSQRREDLARSGSRPWEGMEAERKEAARAQQHESDAQDKKIEATVEQSLAQISDTSRKILLDS